MHPEFQKRLEENFVTDVLMDVNRKTVIGVGVSSAAPCGVCRSDEQESCNFAMSAECESEREREVHFTATTLTFYNHRPSWARVAAAARTDKRAASGEQAGRASEHNPCLHK